MTRIGILDYGVGNLYSLKVALQQLEVQPITTSSLERSKDYDGLILPGVGNFSRVTRSLGSTRKLLVDWVKGSNPTLGVCLGMQLFFESSEEGPGKGLALFPGKVRKLPSNVKIPHIGWNILHTKRQSSLLEGLDNDQWVYFVHSFYPEPLDKKIVTAETDYGLDFAAVISSEDKPLYGTQFHPEKSGKAGEQILKNFVRICRE